MFELLLALGLTLLLVLSAAALAWLPWWVVFGAGLVLAAIGLVAGVPAGLAYHVRLHQALAPRGALPARWWLRPTAFHGALVDGERRAVLRWFRAGAVGFALALGGLLLVAAGAVRSE